MPLILYVKPFDFVNKKQNITLSRQVQIYASGIVAAQTGGTIHDTEIAALFRGKLQHWLLNFATEPNKFIKLKRMIKQRFQKAA